MRTTALIEPILIEPIRWYFGSSGKGRNRDRVLSGPSDACGVGRGSNTSRGGHGSILKAPGRGSAQTLVLRRVRRQAGQRARTTRQCLALAFHVPAMVRHGAGRAFSQLGASLNGLGRWWWHTGQSLVFARAFSACSLHRTSVERQDTRGVFLQVGAGVDGFLQASCPCPSGPVTHFA